MKKQTTFLTKTSKATATLDRCLDNELYDFDENCEEVAASRGCVVVYPKPNQLQIDIDNDDDFYKFTRASELLSDIIIDYKITESSSGLPHRHITVECNREFTDVERIAFQFMLGSDYIRESLNLYRVVNGIENPTRLFENKVN